MRYKFAAIVILITCFIHVSFAQNVGIGTTSPIARLHVTDSNVVFTGPVTVPATTNYNPPIQGAGTRMMWYPQKAAFRAGYVDGTQWNKDNIGRYSFATGSNTIASGDGAFAHGFTSVASSYHALAMGYYSTASGQYSIAMGNIPSATGDNAIALGYESTASGAFSTAIGRLNLASGYGATALGVKDTAAGWYTLSTGYQTTASENYATAMGYQSIASGPYATAMGYQSIASGQYATAMGYSPKAFGQNAIAIGVGSTAAAYNSTALGSYTIASGNFSTVMGVLTTANSYAETVIGAYNTDYTPASATAWYTPDRLFVVGNGTNDNSKSDALVILKNGNIGVGTSLPGYKLHLGNSNNGLRIEGPALSGTGGSALNIGGWGDVIVDVPGVVGGRFIIKENGNIGIGKANPAYRLDVVGDINASGLVRANGIALSSDARFKQNIKTLPNALNNLLLLRGTNYFFNTKSFPEKSFSAEKQMGLIAQEVEKIFPELVSTDKDGYKSVNYIGLIPVMIESIKEQQHQIDELKKLVESMLKNEAKPVDHR